MYAGALVFRTLLPDTFGSPENAFWVGAIATVVVTGLYTVAGGLRAVLYTDSAQAAILFVGSVAITLLGSPQACKSYVSRRGPPIRINHFSPWSEEG